MNPGLNPQLLFMSIIGLTMLPLSMAKSWDRIPLIGNVSKQDLTRHVVALLMNGLSVPGSRTGANGRKS